MVGAKVDRFTLTSDLGRGRLGHTMVASYDDGPDVALTLMRSSGQIDLAAVSRELQAIADVGGEGVIEELVPYDGGWVSVAPYLGPANLGARLRSGPVKPQAALPLFREMTTATADLHTAGLAHGGLRPSNLVRHAIEQTTLISLLQAGAHLRAQPWLGEPLDDGYAAPEVVAGAVADARSDVFSLGRLLVAMLAGTPADAIDALDDPRRTALNELTLVATQPNPAHRHADAGVLLADFDWLISRAAAAVSVGRATPVRTPVPAPAPVTAPVVNAVELPAVPDEPDEPARRPLLIRWARDPEVWAYAALGIVAIMLGMVFWQHRHPALAQGPVVEPTTQPGQQQPAQQQTPTPAGVPSQTTPAAPAAPTVEVSSAYRAVSFHLTAPDGATLERKQGQSWVSLNGRSLTLPTDEGGQNLCARFRSTVESVPSPAVRSCGSSNARTLSTERITPDCTISGVTQVCYRLEASGLRSGEATELIFSLDGTEVDRVTITADADGHASLPQGQRFHFSDADAGKTARVELAGMTYKWQVAAR